MRLIRCDVCDTDLDTDPEDIIVLAIPAAASKLGEDIVLDVCSPACLIKAGQALDDGGDDEETPEPPAGDGQMGITRQASSFRPIDPDTSSRITGVRIKGV